MSRENKNTPSGAGIIPKKRRIIVLLMLLLILIGLVGIDAGGVRGATSRFLLRYAVENQNQTLAKLSLELSSETRSEVNRMLRPAILSGAYDKTRMLLSLGGDPNIIVKKKLPALYWCALEDQPETAGLLVQGGADLDARPYKGWCALSVAIKRHHNRLADLLIDAGASLESDPQLLKKSPLWVAAGKGNLEILERLLTLGVDTNVVIPSKIPGRRPFSLLDHALNKSQYVAAKRLIRETGRSRLNDENVIGEPFISNYCLAGIQRELTRRYYADFNRTVVNPIVQAIQDRGTDDDILALINASLDHIDREDQIGETPLLAAVEHKRKRLVDRLIELGCDVNQPDGYGYTAAQIAAEDRSLEIFRMLVHAGFDPSQSGCREDSLFHFLIQRTLLEPFKILVEEGVELDVSDSMGTPLQIAFSYGRKEFARVLLEGGADPYLKSGDLFSAADYIQRDPDFDEFKPFLKESVEKRGSSLQWIVKDGAPSEGDRLHVVTVYQGRNSQPGRFSRIPVIVSDTERPVVLLLNSYESIAWQIQTAPGVKLKKVYALGYHPQQISGIDETVSQMISKNGDKRYIRTWNVRHKDELLELIEAAEQLAGLRPTTVQASGTGIRFDVDGQKTLDYQQVVNQNSGRVRVMLISSGGGMGSRISDNGLACTYGRAGAFSMAKANAAYNAGKWYFEVYINPDSSRSTPGTYTNVGLVAPNAPHPSFFSSPGGDNGYNYAIPRKLRKQLIGADVVGIAANLDDARLYFSVDGRWINGHPGDAHEGQKIKGGRDYAAGVSVSAPSDQGNDRLVVNFGMTPFKKKVPEGYIAYNGEKKFQ